MKVIAAVDNRYGMLFNHRRVSSDRELSGRILRMAEGARLWMNSYSAKLFPEGAPGLCVDEAYLELAGSGEYCLVEDRSIGAYRDRLEEVILCKWNRDYPSDFRLDFIPEEQKMRRIASEEFRGDSHENITMERWVF